jgi:hypothetical protein
MIKRYFIQQLHIVITIFFSFMNKNIPIRTTKKKKKH